MKKTAWLVGFILTSSLLFGCAESPIVNRDGYYTAEAKFYDAYGWKEFVTIYVVDNHIVAVEYNARNPSGFIKSWDLDYMRVMNATSGSYPNEYTRFYAAALLETQDPTKVDAISGATHSHTSFQELAQAAIDHAHSGDKSIALVELTEPVEDS
jgi:major membrane immunogen (membrane-anchored lipoprotein)